MKLLNLFSLAAVLVTSSVAAQGLHRADNVQVAANVVRDESGFVECAVRAGMSDDVTADVTDFYNLYIAVFPRHGRGAFAVSKTRMNEEQMRDRKKRPTGPVTPGPTKFWIAKSTDSQPLTAIKYLESDRPGVLYGGMLMADAVSALTDIVEGKTMQFAARYPDQKDDRVLSFKGALDADDAESVMACIKAGIPALKAEVEALKREREQIRSKPPSEN
jgi:hypothetical protein